MPDLQPPLPAPHQLDDIPEVQPQDRWPRFTATTLAEGILAVLSLPLVVDGAPLGALNLYAERPGAFTEASLRSGTMLVCDHVLERMGIDEGRSDDVALPAIRVLGPTG